MDSKTVKLGGPTPPAPPISDRQKVAVKVAVAMIRRRNTTPSNADLNEIVSLAFYTADRLLNG